MNNLTKIILRLRRFSWHNDEPRYYTTENEMFLMHHVYINTRVKLSAKNLTDIISDCQNWDITVEPVTTDGPAILRIEAIINTQKEK